MQKRSPGPLLTIPEQVNRNAQPQCVEAYENHPPPPVCKALPIVSAWSLSFRSVATLTGYENSRRTTRCFWERQRLGRCGLWILLLLAAGTMLPTAHASDPEVTDQYRLTYELDARISTNFAGSGTIGFFANPDLENQTYRLEWPNVTYLATHWLHVSGGLLTQYTDNHDSSNELELRPFVGAKLFVPNNAKLTIFNYTRYEVPEHGKTHHARLGSNQPDPQSLRD